VGYEVDFAFSGREGLAKAVRFYPQCLILDVHLPDVSGYAICRHIRQKFSASIVPIVLVSTKAAPLDRSYGLRQGANHYLRKPFTAEGLLQVVWEVVPEHLRPAVLPTSSPTPQQQVLPALSELVPGRVANPDAMRTSSPFARTTVIGVEQAPQLCAAIDGRKTVIELASATGLEIKEVLGVLRVLLRENRVQIYDSAGQLVENAL
jgi:CheY-like chemotaxis protein